MIATAFALRGNVLYVNIKLAERISIFWPQRRGQTFLRNGLTTFFGREQTRLFGVSDQWAKFLGAWDAARNRLR